MTRGTDDRRGPERDGPGACAQVEDPLALLKHGSEDDTFDHGCEPRINLALVWVRHAIPYADLPREPVIGAVGLHD